MYTACYCHHLIRLAEHFEIASEALKELVASIRDAEIDLEPGRSLHLRETKDYLTSTADEYRRASEFFMSSLNADVAEILGWDDVVVMIVARLFEDDPSNGLTVMRTGVPRSNKAGDAARQSQGYRTQPAPPEVRIVRVQDVKRSASPPVRMVTANVVAAESVDVGRRGDFVASGTTSKAREVSPECHAAAAQAGKEGF
jgi:hypothetical protein